MDRRGFIFGIVAVAALVLFGPAARAAEKPHVGISIPSATHGWAAGVGWWAEEEQKKFPDVTFEFQRASSAADQASQIDAMVQKGITALVVLPFDSDTPLPAIKRAKDHDVFVVVVDRQLRQPVADLYLAGDNKAFGRKAAEFMAKKLDNKGSIVVMRGLPVEIDAERVDAFMEVMKAHPDIKVLGSQPGNWNKADAHTTMQNFLTKFDHIDAVWAADDDMALGCEQAIKEAGRTDQMWLLGGAGMKQVVKKVMDRDAQYPADITYPPGMIAAGIALAVADAGDGNERAVFDRIPDSLKVDKELLRATADKDGAKERTIKLDVQLVTPENAKEFYFPESVY